MRRDGRFGYPVLIPSAAKCTECSMAVQEDREGGGLDDPCVQVPHAAYRASDDRARPGYPRFRCVSRFDTVDFPKDGDGCRWDATPHDVVTRVRLQGVGHVKVNQHRRVIGKVKTVSVKREGLKWFVVLTAEQP